MRKGIVVASEGRHEAFVPGCFDHLLNTEVTVTDYLDETHTGVLLGYEVRGKGRFLRIVLDVARASLLNPPINDLVVPQQSNPVLRVARPRKRYTGQRNYTS